MARAFAGIFMVAILLASCSADSPSTSVVGDATTAGEVTPSVATTETQPSLETSSADCGPIDGTPWEPGPESEMVTLIEDEGLTVRGAVYPRPDYEGRPWSQWGQGIVLADGRYLSAIGDHLGADGDSFVYEYDPETGTLTQIIDVLSLVDHVPGEWGFGKVHGQMVAGPCDDVLFATYWGSRKELTYTDSYGGDRLFRIDPDAEAVEDLGVLGEERGVPSLASWPAGGLVYAEAVDPTRSPNGGEFVVLDADSGDVVFSDGETSHVGFRAMAVDASGRAYFSVGEGRLAVFDPATNSVAEYPGELPGGWLRAATAPSPDGTIFAVTREPDIVFSMTPEGDVTTLGDARGYVASMVADPEGETIYYVPDAHGRSFMQGTPLIAVDTQTGEDRVVVEMNAAAEEILGVRLGGSYNVAMSADGGTIYVGMNAAPVSENNGGFGEVVLLEITLP